MWITQHLEAFKQDASLLTQEDTVSLVKNIIASDFRNLRKQLIDKHVHSMKRKIEEEKRSH